MPAVHTQGLSKIYDNGRGCRNITLTVGKGEAFGFLGPNGAGKSTFVKMLVGLVRPSGGEGELFGSPIGSLEARRLIGYLPELYRYPEWLTGEEVMRMHAGLLGLENLDAKSKIRARLDEVGIGKRGSDRVKQYSKGMQQRLGLACALLGDPDILFLDEPSSAMDPVGRREVRELLLELKKRGKTLFLNSHLMEDVEAVCDRMALMLNGDMIRSGSVPDMLKTKVRWRFKVGGFSLLLLDWLQEESGVVLTAEVPADAGWDEPVWLEAELEDEYRAALLNALIVEQGMTLYESNAYREKLEDWFLETVSGRDQRGESR
ncbi:ABC transporter ATP-binding protein [Saccharibacillus sp. VR-M41]|uniref:ABC transporter ATP-binding protein n=2 Tax=Saccharibacillus alkalitolerans TaxID=2705290 RepID=A0ABX0FBV4_9BACL|nr:ABC transporter ATP-binding protein [Saccharibacillus alkalitolerans]